MWEGREECDYIGTWKQLKKGLNVSITIAINDTYVVDCV